jgi:hypothetical protein
MQSRLSRGGGWRSMIFSSNGEPISSMRIAFPGEEHRLRAHRAAALGSGYIAQYG